MKAEQSSGGAGPRKRSSSSILAARRTCWLPAGSGAQVYCRLLPLPVPWARSAGISPGGYLAGGPGRGRRSGSPLRPAAVQGPGAAPRDRLRDAAAGPGRRRGGAGPALKEGGGPLRSSRASVPGAGRSRPGRVQRSRLAGAGQTRTPRVQGPGPDGGGGGSRHGPSPGPPLRDRF